MAESSRATLRQLFLVRYEDLKRSLSRRLGSADLASEALQETYLRLECGPQIGAVRSPHAYLFRTAYNIAANRRIAENRRLTAVEAEALLEIADERPDPGQVAESRSDIEALKRAIAELPARRRDIFLAAWRDEIPHQEIAERHGITIRTVQIDLKHALEHCAQRLGRPVKK